MKDLRIVIPAHNEETGVGEVIDRVKKACHEAEIIVVDDASKDSTAQIAREKGITVISNSKNLGYGGALKAGFSYNIDHGCTIKYFAFLDADGTYPPEHIPELYYLCRMRDFDIVTGSRLLGGNKGMPFVRKLGNKLFAILASVYLSSKVTDTGSGLRVFKASLLPWIQDLPDGLNLTPAMTMNALFEGLVYTEVAIEYNKRMGSSNLSAISDGYRFLKVIMDATRKYRPVMFFCTLGIPFIIINSIVKLVIIRRPDS